MSVGSPFVGRGTELGLLTEALDAIEAGEPRAMEVVGPAGIGKTRLLAEVARRSEERGHLVLGGSGSEFERDLPFWVFVDALDEYVEGLDPRRIGRLDSAVRAGLGQVLPAMAGTVAGAHATLHERYRTHRAVRDLLEHLAAGTPLVLILDDVHWADQASLDLLVALLHRPPAAGVLFLIAARPRQLPQRAASAFERARRDGTLVGVELDALSEDEARSLVGAEAAALYEDSGGNPFFLEQLARSPVRPNRTGDAVAVAGVPPQVMAALSDELTLLSADARRALDGASVAGDPFEVDLAGAAADMAETPLLLAVDELVACDFVRATDTPRRFRFRHPIVRRAVYEATPDGWRIGAHERAAAALADRGATATARANHVARSARHGDLEAVTTLADAGRESAARAPDAAARYFAAALALLPDDAQPAARVELLLPLSIALAAVGRFTEAHAAVVECLELVPASDRAQRTQLTAVCARVEHLLGQHESAHDRLVRALEDLPEDEPDHVVSLMIELTMDGLHRLNYEAMFDWGRRAARAGETLEDDALRATALAAAARGAAFPGITDVGRRARDEAAALIDSLPDSVLSRRLDALTFLAGAELYLHMFDEGHRHAERAVAIGRATGQGQQFPLLFAILGQTAYFEGRSRDMIGALDGAVEAARLSGNAQTLAWSLYARAMAAFQLGDIATAISNAQEAVDLVDDGMPSHHSSHCAFALAEASLELGRPDRAAELLMRTAGGPDLPLVAPSFRAVFLETLARAHLELGDRDAAERAAAEAKPVATKTGLDMQHGCADRALAAVALHDNDAERAAELAIAAAARMEQAGAMFEVARSLTLAGRALGRGDRERARGVLEQAALLATERGAERVRQAAERELRQLGHRIHRRTTPGASDGEGVATLTRRELEIARRIVDRRTNRQIAEELYLSPKTVETHIRNIFAKLGVDSRIEVARIVERTDRLAAAS